MKKILALLLALCLLCCSAASLAEAAAEAKTVELDGFSLDIAAGQYYQVFEKTASQPYVVVYPFYADADYSTNYNAVWAGGEFSMTPELMKDQAGNIEANVRAGIEPYGITVDSVVVGEPFDTYLNGRYCVAADIRVNLSYMGQSVAVYEREIAVGSIGYIFTISASSEEALGELFQELTRALIMF